jgi:putative hydrolase of the HAD superfamily
VDRLADLDAVTLDANGTLVGLVDPVPELVRVLRERGIARVPEAVQRAFEAEGRYYTPRSLEGRDAASLETLRRDCAAVFLTELEAELDPAEFAPSYVGTLVFDVLPGVREALAQLQASGLELAVVANWDLTLAERLEELGLAEHFTAIVSSAEAGAAKPEPAIFESALNRLGVQAQRALHIGDSTTDEEGARAAGMRFEWAPVPRALEVWR